MTNDPVSRYRQDFHSNDPATRAVARRQLASLSRASQPRHAAPFVPTPSRWRHVPLADLLTEHGNSRMYQRSGGHLESGHEPLHHSKSGRCVLIDTASGRCWCRSCGRRFDAAGYVMDIIGLNYRQAALWLTERYGSPADSRADQSRAPKWIEVK